MKIASSLNNTRMQYEIGSNDSGHFSIASALTLSIGIKKLIKFKKRNELKVN